MRWYRNLGKTGSAVESIKSIYSLLNDSLDLSSLQQLVKTLHKQIPLLYIYVYIQKQKTDQIRLINHIHICESYCISVNMHMLANLKNNVQRIGFLAHMHILSKTPPPQATSHQGAETTPLQTGRLN